MEQRIRGEFMELRSYEDLRQEIAMIYQRFSDEELKNYYNNCYSEAPKFVYTYDSGENFNHTIIITIPGYKAFRKDDKEKFYGHKIANDIKITIQDTQGRKNLTHQEIINDLYNKINQSDDRKAAYDICKSFLTFLYQEETLNLNEFLHNFSHTFTGHSLCSLSSFIRWCAVQETINYPNGWGRDLCFARYFEALYAGFLGDEEMKNQIINCAKNRSRPINLKEISNHYSIVNKIYNNLLNYRME